jgi:hypothetical protein
MIAQLRPGVLDYLSSFGLVAIALNPGGKLTITSNPTGAVAAWWCPVDYSEALLRRARKLGLPIAAHQLHVTVAEHAHTVARATAALRKIESGVSWAQRAGVLHDFNGEYRRRRLEAEAEGQPFPSYSEA